MWLLAWCPVLILGAWTLVYYCYPQPRVLDRKRILLVTAHPDDECMFFSPTLVHLSKTAQVHLLCLSSGIIF